MSFLRRVILLVFILLAGTEVWTLWTLKRYSSMDPSNYPSIPNGSVIVNGGDETAEYAEFRSIGIVAVNNLKQKGIKGAVSKKDLAEIVLKSDPRYPPEAIFWIDTDGNLIDTRNNRKYQVYSDGFRVVVKYSGYNKPEYFPY